ncbi:hypothetical protein DsansV1_C04g0036901 [Dioscorea sansibarensis]
MWVFFECFLDLAAIFSFKGLVVASFFSLWVLLVLALRWVDVMLCYLGRKFECCMC